MGALKKASCAAVERGWGLYLLQPALASLEEVFVQLTQREDDQSERASE